MARPPREKEGRDKWSALQRRPIKPQQVANCPERLIYKALVFKTRAVERPHCPLLRYKHNLEDTSSVGLCVRKTAQKATFEKNSPGRGPHEGCAATLHPTKMGSHRVARNQGPRNGPEEEGRPARAWEHAAVGV